MDILEGPDFMYSRICLRPFGLWPFQDARSKLISRIVTLIAVSTVLIPHMMKAYEFRNDLQLAMMCILSLLYYAHYVIKFWCIVLLESKFRNVLERIKDDFGEFGGEYLDQLKNYSSEARKFNTFYTMYLCLTVVIYNTTAFIPHTLDFLFPLDNATRPRHPVRYIKYNVRLMDDNFYFGLVHGMIFDVVAIAIIIGFDTLYINCAQHACALFKIVVVNLRNSTKPTQLRSHSPLDEASLEHVEEVFYEKLIGTVNAHKHAIEFTDNLESTYALVNFLMIGIAVLTMTVSEFETIANINDVDIMCRFLFYTFGELLSILYQNWPGQRVINHSLRVNSSCYECEWYRRDFSPKRKKLLLFMMLMSGRPCRLTAGTLFTLDLENYVKIFKASLSYFAFLTSVANISIK